MISWHVPYFMLLETLHRENSSWNILYPFYFSTIYWQIQWTSKPKIAKYTPMTPIIIVLPSPAGTSANL